MGISHSNKPSGESDKTVIRLRRKDVPWLRSEEPMTEAIIDPARQETLDNQMMEFTAGTTSKPKRLGRTCAGREKGGGPEVKVILRS